MTSHALLGSALERGQSCPHDFIDEEEVASYDGARVDHLPLDVVVVVDAEVGRIDHFAARAIHPNRTSSIMGFTQ